MRFWALLQSEHIAGRPKAPFGRFSCAGRTEFDLDSPIVLHRPAVETAFSGILPGGVESVQNSSAGRAETARRLSHRASPSEIVLSTRAGTPPTTVIGGTSFAGGEGGILQSFIGLMAVQMLSTCMSALSVDGFWQKLIEGLMIVAIIAADCYSRKRKRENV